MEVVDEVALQPGITNVWLSESATGLVVEFHGLVVELGANIAGGGSP